MQESLRRNAAATRTRAGGLRLLAVLFLLLPTAAHSGVISGPVYEVFGDPMQPPEQPPENPPAEEEEEASGEAAQPPAEEAPPTGETAGEGTPEEGEATGEESEGAGEESESEGEESESEGEEPEDESEGTGRRAPEIATAPVGILPGRILAAPAPVLGASIVGMVLGGDGFLLHMGGGEVIAYERDGVATRWGLPGADAAFVAGDSETVVLLDGRGDVTLRRFADGVRVGGFSTGRKPELGLADLGLTDRGTADGVRRGPIPAALSAGVLYWVSDRTLHGFRIPSGNPVLEVPLPDGEAASLVAVPPVATESAGDASPLLVVSLGSGGVAAVSSVGGTTAGAVRWHAEAAGRVTGPVLASADEGLVIFGDDGGDLAAVDLDDGKRRWRWRLAEGFHHPPLLNHGRLYAATKANSLYCFDAKRGGERWRAALPGRPAAPPLRIAGAILVVTQDGLLVELNAVTGARIGQPHDLGAEVVGVMSRLGDGAREDGWRDRRVFLGLRDGRLAVFGPRAATAGR